MAAVYLFKEPLGKEVVRALFKLGPGYKVKRALSLSLSLSLSLLSYRVCVLLLFRVSSILMLRVMFPCCRGRRRCVMPSVTG